MLFVPLFIIDTQILRDKIGKKNYERKRKSEKARGERREIDAGCQSMSIAGMYKKISHRSIAHLKLVFSNIESKRM